MQIDLVKIDFCPCNQKPHLFKDLEFNSDGRIDLFSFDFTKKSTIPSIISIQPISTRSSISLNLTLSSSGNVICKLWDYDAYISSISNIEIEGLVGSLGILIDPIKLFIFLFINIYILYIISIIQSKTIRIRSTLSDWSHFTIILYIVLQFLSTVQKCLRTLPFLPKKQFLRNVARK